LDRRVLVFFFIIVVVVVVVESEDDVIIDGSTATVVSIAVVVGSLSVDAGSLVDDDTDAGSKASEYNTLNSIESMRIPASLRIVFVEAFVVDVLKYGDDIISISSSDKMSYATFSPPALLTKSM
jgi:hypothetical protein